jgi:hypothetical protein
VNGNPNYLRRNKRATVDDTLPDELRALGRDGVDSLGVETRDKGLAGGSEAA